MMMPTMIINTRLLSRIKIQEILQTLPQELLFLDLMPLLTAACWGPLPREGRGPLPKEEKDPLFNPSSRSSGTTPNVPVGGKGVRFASLSRSIFLAS